MAYHSSSQGATGEVPCTAVQSPQVVTHTLQDEGVFPNNANLPLLIYRDAVVLPERQAAAFFEAVFAAHQWGSAWRNGIYGVHHYHSTAHEVLGVFQGQARVQFGGEQGVILSLQSGDVVVIPAGVAHKNLGASRDFGVVGAYPLGQHWDVCYGKPGERPRADDNIARVSLPHADPVYGTQGPLVEAWMRT
jgi:uncharacterized protein YjlB